MERLLNQHETAEMLGVSVRTLERLRVLGTGPRYCRVGRLVRYRVCDLEEWVCNSIQKSTSEVTNQFREEAYLSRQAA